jgi:hypothetical protein
MLIFIVASPARPVRAGRVVRLASAVIDRGEPPSLSLIRGDLEKDDPGSSTADAFDYPGHFATHHNIRSTRFKLQCLRQNARL